GSRLVERDVTVGPDPENLQVDAACRADRALIRLARRRDVGGKAVGAFDRAGNEIHPGHEYLVDDGAIALRVIGGPADVLVEGEGAGLPEGELSGLDAHRELVVDRQRR